MRIRKNINCLSSNELHDLREAFAALYRLPESHPNSYARIAGLHGSPAPSYCVHSNTGFLTWHRAYLLRLEDALRTIRCGVTLPYWDWSSGNTTGLPAAFKNPTYQNRSGNTVDNPLYRGPKVASIGGGFTSRRADIDTTTFGDLATQIQSALNGSSWNSFIAQLNSAHGAVHGRIGGDMGSVPTAGFDPIFYFHHCNVDRLGAIWQAKNPAQIPNAELNMDLVPFNKPYTNNWYKGRDFEHIHDLDYRYRSYCFLLPFWPPLIFEPLEPFRPVVFPISDGLLDFKGSIQLRLQSPMMTQETFELRVFINDPKANIDTPIVDNPCFLGSFGVFGMGGMKMTEHSALDIRMDISEAFKKQLKKMKKKEVSFSLVKVFAEKAAPCHKMKMSPKFSLSMELE